MVTAIDLVISLGHGHISQLSIPLRIHYLDLTVCFEWVDLNPRSLREAKLDPHQMLSQRAIWCWTICNEAGAISMTLKASLKKQKLKENWEKVKKVWESSERPMNLIKLVGFLRVLVFRCWRQSIRNHCATKLLKVLLLIHYLQSNFQK